MKKKHNNITHYIHGEELILLPQKGIYWSSQQILLISDVHLGKVDHFRKNGIALPGSASIDNYYRLREIIRITNPKKIIFLGDLFHSSYNQDWEVFKVFLSGYADIKIELVIGNHDCLSLSELQDVLGAVHTKSVVMGPFLLSHHPEDHKMLYNLCGHIHPAFKIKKNKQAALRLPCFHFSLNRCTLPAFGTFTGMHTISAESSDSIYVIAEDEVIPIP